MSKVTQSGNNVYEFMFLHFKLKHIYIARQVSKILKSLIKNESTNYARPPSRVSAYCCFILCILVVIIHEVFVCETPVSVRALCYL